jgi:hypothetical protein
MNANIQNIINNIMTDIAEAGAADNNEARQSAQDKLMAILAMHANSTTASTGAASSYKLDVPKLDKDATTDWPVFKVQVQAYLKQQGIDPGSAQLPEKQESSLYLLLLGGIKETGLSFLIINDNPTQLGTKAWQALREHFEPDSEAHRMTSLSKLLNNGYDQSEETDIGRWLGHWMRHHDQLMMSKPTVSDLLNSVLLHHLPKSPAWTNLINGLMSSNEPLTRQKIMSAVLAFDRNEQCRLGNGLVPNSLNALLAPAKMPATQPPGLIARASQAPGWQVQHAQPVRRNDVRCDRCGGHHASSACMRTQNYKCARCSEIGHYETYCGKSQQAGATTHMHQQNQHGNNSGTTGTRAAPNTATAATRPSGTGIGWGRTAF